MALKAGEFLGAIDQQRLSAAVHSVHSPGALLDGAAEQRRLQVPIAEHRGGRTEQARIDHGDARPARIGVDAFEHLMRLVIRHNRDRRLRLLRQAKDQIEGGREPVGNHQNDGSGLEPADRLAHVANRKDADTIEPQPLESVLERLWDALDHHHQWGGAGSGSAAGLIFHKRSAGERKQGSQGPAVVLVIGAD